MWVYETTQGITGWGVGGDGCGPGYGLLQPAAYRDYRRSTAVRLNATWGGLGLPVPQCPLSPGPGASVGLIVCLSAPVLLSPPQCLPSAPPLSPSPSASPCGPGSRTPPPRPGGGSEHSRWPVGEWVGCGQQVLVGLWRWGEEGVAQMVGKAVYDALKTVWGGAGCWGGAGRVGGAGGVGRRGGRWGAE